MPRVKPAIITLRDGTILRDNVDKIDYGAHLLTLYAEEMQSTPVERKKWNKTITVNEMKSVRVPIKSWPYAAIKEVDWGYMPKEQYDRVMKELAEAKQAAEAKKAEKSDESKQDGEKV